MMQVSAPGVALCNLGCRVNRVEVDLIAARLERAGCRIVESQNADVVVINTCAVTGEAQTKTRKAVRHHLHLPQAPVVIATGCAATLFADELRRAAPGVIVEPDKQLVVERALAELGLTEQSVGGTQLATFPTPTGRMRPGVKIQDGCDNRCSFCIVWKARGPSRSLAASEVVDAVREACDRGAHEVVLTGINLGSYRAHSNDVLPEGARLNALLAHLLEQTGIERIRLSSIEPPDATDELLDVMAASGGRVAPFLHVCLQSGSDAVLRRMRRVYNTHLFRTLVDHARNRMPNMALGTDVIVGFPGETDDEFKESLEFCREMGFSRMHVFRYSRRPGTPAADAPGQIEADIAAKRAGKMRELAASMRVSHALSLEGIEDAVLVLSPGRSVGSHLYDIEVSPLMQAGSLRRVTIHARGDGSLWGEPST